MLDQYRHVACNTLDQCQTCRQLHARSVPDMSYNTLYQYRASYRLTAFWEGAPSDHEGAVGEPGGDGGEGWKDLPLEEEAREVLEPVRTQRHRHRLRRENRVQRHIHRQLEALRTEGTASTPTAPDTHTHAG
eukprot:2243833-Rhodomonas_salina.2